MTSIVPPPSYSNEIQVTDVSRPYIINDVEFDDLETIKFASDNDNDLENIKYASDDDVNVSSDMDKMEYDDVMITHVTPLHPRKSLERFQKIIKYKKMK